MPSYATLTATNTAAVGNWVYIQGCTSTAGQPLNNTVAQVSAVNLSSSSITVGFPFNVATLSASDSCTATVTNVGIAYDAQARYQQANTSFVINSNRALSNALGVGIYFGSRVDTGTRVWNVQVIGANLYAYYFADGGLNVDFDKGWRADAIGKGATYWRVTGEDSVDISNGTTDNFSSAASTEGASMVFDAGACGSLYNNVSVIATTKHLKIEVNEGLNPGIGAITLYDCPTNPRPGQLQISGDGLWIAPYTQSTAGVNISPFAVIPANDLAIEVSLLNSIIPEGNQTTNFSPRWLGVPYAQSLDHAGEAGVMPVFSYMPPLTTLNSAYGPTQFLNDTNFAGITWAYSTRASMMLYSDTAFAALPNGTSLAAGQLIAPPSYWLGANGKRYAQQSVYTAGTTGTLNGGATTCTHPSSGAGTLQCNTAAGLMIGQYVTWNGLSTQINKIDDTVDSAAQVYLQNNPASGSNLPLTFTAPVLGPEMQLPTKSAAAPTTLAWSQGDTEQNSGATANGICGWVNVGAGTPGTWATILCGNSSGKLLDSQVIDAGGVSTSPVCPNGTGGALTTSGCAGGNSIPGGALGSVAYQSAASTTTVTAANTSVTTECLTETGTGSTGAAPIWGSCAGGGGMTWPSAAGIAVYGGSSAWGTSLTAPAGTIVGTTDTQTLTNKTVDGVTPTTMGYVDPTSSIQTQLGMKAPLASPTFTGTVSGVTSTMVGLGNVTNTTQTQSTIVPNTAPSAGQDLVGNAGGTAYAPVTMSGDCTRSSTGAITCTESSGTAFGTGAFATIANYATTSTTVNGHALSSSVVVSASDLTTGTLPAAQLPMMVYQAGGDTVCAQAADSTIGVSSLTISSVSSNASTMTFVLSSAAPSWFYQGQIVQTQGNTTGGYNGGPWTVSSVSSATVVVASALNPGAGTGGGTMSLYCSNQGADAITSTPVSPNTSNVVGLGSNYFQAGTILTATNAFSVWSSSAAPAVSWRLIKGGFPNSGWIAPNGAIPNSTNGKPGATGIKFVGNSATEVNIDAVSIQWPTSAAVVGSGYSTQPFTYTGAAGNLGWAFNWTATALASISTASTTGCTVVGTVGQTVNLASFNNSCTATAVCTLGTLNTLVGATCVPVRGQSCTAAATTATCSAGTVTSASGTATLTSVLGGATGNAVSQRYFETTNF